MRFLRDFILLAALLMVAPWRSRTRRHLRRLRQRFSLSKHSGPRVVVHAVSLGEVNAAARLIRKLDGHGLNVVCSATTLSGKNRSRELHPSCDQVEWPLDVSFCCRRWLDHVKPEVLVLVELEVWPTLVRMAHARGIPVMVVNGRLSERSFRKSMRFKHLLRDGYSNLTRVFAQSKEDADRFSQMGVCDQLISVHTNLKWERDVPSDEDVQAIRRALRLDPGRPMVLFASSAPEEHDLFAKCLVPNCQAVIAPRRPEWFADAHRAFPNARLRTDPVSEGDIVVLNTLGELDAVFVLADVVIMGRSFGNRHGSDPMGPAATGRPILIGPSYGDFISSVTALNSAGALEVVSASELRSRLFELVHSCEVRNQMGAAGKAVAASSQGIASRLAEEIVAQTQPPRRDRGGAEEKEESLQHCSTLISALGAADDHK